MFNNILRKTSINRLCCIISFHEPIVDLLRYVEALFVVTFQRGSVLVRCVVKGCAIFSQQPSPFVVLSRYTSTLCICMYVLMPVHGCMSLSKCTLSVRLSGYVYMFLCVCGSLVRVVCYVIPYVRVVIVWLQACAVDNPLVAHT